MSFSHIFSHPLGSTPVTRSQTSRNEAGDVLVDASSSSASTSHDAGQNRPGAATDEAGDLRPHATSSRSSRAEYDSISSSDDSDMEPRATQQKG